MIQDVNMVNQYNCFSKGNTFIITLSVKSEYNVTTTFHRNEHQYRKIPKISPGAYIF